MPEMTMMKIGPLLAALVPLVAAGVKWLMGGRFTRAAGEVERADLCRRLGLDEQAAAAESAARVRLLRHTILRERRWGRFLPLSRWDAAAAALWALGVVMAVVAARSEGVALWASTAALFLFGCLACFALLRETAEVEEQVATQDRKVAAVLMSKQEAQSQQSARVEPGGRIVRALRELTRK